jgi:rubrerythrin
MKTCFLPLKDLKCPECGAKIKDKNVKKCPKCGKLLFFGDIKS